MYAKDDPGTLIDFPIYNYSPTGNPFKAHIKGIDWDTQYIKIVADLSSCTSTSGGADCIFSLVGTLVADGTGTNWNDNGATTLHVYYSGGTTFSSVWVNKSSGTTKMSSNPSVSDNTNVVIEISKAKGMVVDGVQSAANGTVLSDIFNSSNVTFSSEEGNGRMHGTYKSVTLEKLPAPDASFSNTRPAGGSVISKVFGDDTYSPNGVLFTRDISVDWNTQKVVAQIDLSNCKTSTEDIFSIGDDVVSFNTMNIHVYRTATGSLSAYTNSGKNDCAFTGKTPSSNVINVELSKENGLVVDGTTMLSASKIAQYSGLFNQSELKVGSGEGTNQYTYATYNYINVVSSDYYTEATTTSSNTLSESTINTFSSQNNVKVQLDRTFAADGWYTFCVPFAVDGDMLESVFGEGVELRTFKDMSGTTMNFEAKTAIEAGVPYLLKVAQEVSNPVFDGVDVVAPTSTSGMPAAKGDGSYYMQGVYGVTTLSTDGTHLFLGGNNKFYKPSVGGEKMKGMRAYFVVPQGTNMAALIANIDGEATAIGQIRDAAVAAPAPVYNLNGQCVGNTLQGLARGIYVQNGKKYVVK